MKRLALIAIGMICYQCATFAAIPSIETEALVALYNNTNGAGWTTNTNWLTGDPCSNDWYGVTCDESASITQILLFSNNLLGSIPAELGNLANLEWLWLFNNKLSGPIPAQLGNLAKLEQMDLADNQLSGSIPGTLGGLTNLKWLELNNNQLSESIPTELGNLTNLGYILMYNNQLTGSIPAELGNLANLEWLWLFNNKLNGPIPAQLGNLAKLEQMDLAGNRLSGAIPATFASLGTLADSYGLDLSWNALHTIDADLDIFMDLKSGSDWSSTQTTAPKGVLVTNVSENSVSLSWNAIEFTSNGGGYTALYSRTLGGPYIDGGSTATKSTTSLTVSGLGLGTRYYLVVRSNTDSHAFNQSELVSEDSNEVNAKTLGEDIIYNNGFEDL